MFKGSFPALVTPFKDDGLDLAALKNLVEWHVAQGSNGLVPVGTTGESPTVSHAEHRQVVEEVIRAAAGRSLRATVIGTFMRGRTTTP